MRVRRVSLRHRKQPDGPPPPFRYWAFISYSQQDKKWSHWLHRRLESYRPPRQLHIDGLEGTGSVRLAPVFLDREELATSASLGESVRQALTQSMYLVVVCSPRAVRSRWVDQEIRTFQQLGRGDRILCFIVDGQPNADSSGAAELECLPEALRRPAALAVGSANREEPLAADCRASRDGRTKAFFKLAAAILQAPFDLLWNRERRRQRQRRLQLAGVVSAVLLIVAALAVSWFMQRQIALLNLQQREQQTIREQLLNGDGAGAVALLGKALSEGRGSDSFETLFRFWHPALHTLDSIVQSLSDGSVVSWRGSDYVVAGGRLRALPDPVALAGLHRARRHLITISPEGIVAFWRFPELSAIHSFQVEGVDLGGAFQAPSSSVIVLTGDRQSSYAGGASPVLVIVDPESGKSRTIGMYDELHITPGCQEVVYRSFAEETADLETWSIPLRLDGTGRFPSPRRHVGPVETGSSPGAAGCLEIPFSYAPHTLRPDLSWGEGAPVRRLPFPSMVVEARQWSTTERRIAPPGDDLDEYEEDQEVSFFARGLQYADEEWWNPEFVRWTHRFKVDGTTIIVGGSSAGAQFGARNLCATRDERVVRLCVKVEFHGDGGESVLSPGRRFFFIQNLSYMGYSSFDIVHLPDLKDATPERTPPGWGPTYSTVSFSPTSSELALVAENGELWLYRWSEPDRRFELFRIQTLPGDSVRMDPESNVEGAEAISTIRFVGASTLLVARGSEVWALDFATGDLLWRNPVEDLGEGPILLAISPLHDSFAAYSRNRIRLYESTSGAPLSQVFIVPSIHRPDAGDGELPRVAVEMDGGVLVELQGRTYRRRPPLSTSRVEPALRDLQFRTGIDPRNGRSTLAKLPGSLAPPR